MTDLHDRVKREKSAYDSGSIWEQSNKLQRRFAHVFACPNTEAAERYFSETVRQAATGASVLDYGCYKGELAAELATFSPKGIVGIDVSENAIQDAIERYGHVAEFRQMDAHQLDFPDGSFDLVVGRSILHHLEYETAVTELRRVLAPDGLAVFFEPLRDNPMAKLLRALTPKARTSDELPLSRQQIRYGDRTFGTAAHRFVNLFSVPAGMLSSHLFQGPDNVLTSTADWLDRRAAQSWIRYWMRSVVLVWRKTD